VIATAILPAQADVFALSAAAARGVTDESRPESTQTPRASLSRYAASKKTV